MFGTGVVLQHMMQTLLIFVLWHDLFLAFSSPKQFEKCVQTGDTVSGCGLYWVLLPAFVPGRNI